MPNPTIGTETFVNMVGAPSERGQQVETWSPIGSNGTGARLLGVIPSRFVLTTFVDVGSAAAGKVKLKNYKGIQGTIVNVVQANGITWNKVLIIAVDPTEEIKKMEAAVGGINSPSTHSVSARWQCLFIGVG